MITVYHSTARTRDIATLDKPKNGAWINVVAPDQTDLDNLAENFQLDRDLLNDAVDIYESPRVEADSGTVYIYTRYCYPEGHEIATEPLLIIYNPDYIITVLRIENTILDRLQNGNQEVVTTQKTKLLLLILNEVNRSYRLQLNKVSKQVLRIRAQVRHAELRTEIS